MKAPSLSRRPVAINLLRPARGRSPSSLRRGQAWTYGVVIVIGAVSWVAVGVALALLLGWHPRLPMGP